ncbi:hypothetical protein GH714_022450 [Hevea brasiliensis]|uniref:SHSP domain-containing protein n=1 Tax=Hevea brasiliensis TaxID=3981 RepID=A0A6A6M3P0_HEVBR|nr:hypothetical protein GH714_022450 [Hevea brasiliensis]
MAEAIVYEDFEPYSKWQREQERDMLEVHLNGFKKDQLKIQLSNLGVMIITGERPLEGSKRSRFRKEFRLSSMDYKTDEIRAKMCGDILSIFLPKKTVLSSPSSQNNKSTLPLQNKENERTQPKTIPSGTTTENTKTSKFSGYRFRLPDNIVLNLGTRNVVIAFALGIVVGAFVMYMYRQLSLY